MTEVPIVRPVADWLHDVQDERRRYRGFIEAPATPEQIAALREDVRADLGIDLPEDYAAFLALSNGLEWNGTLFYATERRAESADRPFRFGLLEVNLEHRGSAVLGKLLALGESDMDMYIYDPSRREYRIIDRFSTDTSETYPSFEALFDAVFRTQL